MAVRDLDFRVSVRSGQLRALEDQLQRTVVRMLELGPAGGRSGVQAAAGLQRVERAAGSLAQARVRAAVITRRADEAELLALQQLARTQKRGSAEFIETNRLAAQSARQLGREEIAAGHEAAIGFRSARREVGSLARGGLAASGIFRRFGRTIAFAGAGFLGGFTVVSQIRDVFEATQAQTREEGALQAQLAASGLSWTRYGRRVEAVARAQAEFAAVNETKVQQSLTGLIRTTGDITTAERLNAIALDVSAAKHRDVVQVASVLGKVYDGNVGAARRLGISLGKDVKDPLTALNIIQRQFAGQAEAAANTAGGAYTRFSNALTRDRVAFGEGILPVITRDLNVLEKKLQDPATIAAIQRIGEEVSQELEAKLTSAAHFVERNWPEIKRDFHDAGHALEVSAAAAGLLAKGLSEIAGIVPGHDSLIRLLVEGALLNKLSRGRLLAKAAPAAASGGLTAERLAGGLGVASLFGRLPGKARVEASLPEILKGGGRLARLTRLGALTIAVDLALSKRDRDQVVNAGEKLGDATTGKIPSPKQGLLGGLLGLPEHSGGGITGALLHFGLGIRPGKDQKAADGAQQAIERAFRTGISTGTDQGLTHFNERITRVAGLAEEAAKKAAAAATKRFDAAFKTVEDKLLQAFDARTSAILDSFDAQTSKLEEKLSATVRVPSLHETFTVTVNGKTPAERELEALDKLQERRNFRRDIFDAREQLAQAKAGGDPFQIRQAQRALQDAQTERRRSQLETRAAAERKAADAAIAARKTGFERRRAQERRDLEAERNLQREHLQAELEAERKQIEKGKVTAAQGQRAIVNTMRKYGINYKQAGIDLGAAFGTGLHQALAAANTAIDRLEQKLAAANRSAGKLAKVSEAALAGRAGRAIAAAVSAALGLPPPTPPLQPEKVTPAQVARLKREERKAREIETLVQIHPTLRRLERALQALGFDPHVPARLDAAGLRLVGRELPLGHLEKLLAFLRAHPRGLATGGVVDGPSGRDVIPARLTRGEVVFEAGQQRALMRRLGVSGGPNELFRHVQRLTGSPWSSPTRFERFAGGGVAGSSYDELLRQLTRRLAELELAQFRAPQRGRPGHRIDPVQIETLVGRRLGAAGERRLGHAGTLKLEQRLAQEQAHPFSEGLLRATPTGTQLGRAGRSGRALADRRVSDVPRDARGAVTVVVPVGAIQIGIDGKKLAQNTRELLLKQSKRGYVPRRASSPRRGSNLGLQ